jgi:hypothetical protein
MLEGFRYWLAVYRTGDLTNWEEAWNLYASSLGSQSARAVVEPLARFVRTIRDWSLCPLACFPGGCRHICRQECMALAMVSAGQHRDLDCLAAAMRYLLDPDGHEEAMLPAIALAEAMKESELLLLPVSKQILEEVAGRPQHLPLH